MPSNVTRMRMPDRRFLLPALALAGLAALGGVAVVQLRGGDDSAEDGSLLVFAVFGESADVIYTAPASDPGARTEVLTVPHAPGWGLTPAAAPANSLIAYTVLPPGAVPRQDTPAELWVVDFAKGGQPQRLAVDADLTAAPVFDREGRTVVYRRSEPGGAQALVRVDITSTGRRDVHRTEAGTFGAYPVGFSVDGDLLVASISTAGTDIYRTREGEAPALLVHASDELAREWSVSPDGRTLSYLAPEQQAERIVHRLHVISVAAGAQPPRLPAAPSGDQFGVVWAPDGSMLAVGREASPDARAGALTLQLGAAEAQTLPPPQAGFDVPLAWSRDGASLAVRSFDGVTADQPGRASTVVISADGERRPVTASGEVVVFGWVPRG